MLPSPSMQDFHPTFDDSRSPWWRKPRWLYASISFLLGVVYTATAVLLGLEFRLGETDVTWWVGGTIEITFAVFGHLLGLMVESRRGERAAAERSRRQMEELAALQGRLAQLEKLASLGQLAGAVAHEVRNPLAIIRSQAQNLRETFPDETAEWEALEAMIEEIDRLAHVTSSLVSFARPMSLRREPVRVRALLHRAQLLARQLLADQAVEVEPGADGPGDGLVEGDPDLLCQLVLGLLENAARVSPRGGRISVGWRETGQWVEIVVCDRGPGVPAALRQKIFEPFFTTREDGHGLGLSVARQIVVSHGGEIGVEDAEPEGACFRVRLPRCSAPEGKA